MITNCAACNEPMKQGSVYYQCPVTTCKRELGYCVACGGSQRASNEMADHVIADHFKQPTPPTKESLVASGSFVETTEQTTPNDVAPDGMETVACPRCGSPTMSGFGMVGGGYGAYLVCEGDNCDFFFKEQSSGE